MTGHASAWRPRDKRPESLDEEEDDDEEEEDNYDDEQDMFEDRIDEPESLNGYPVRRVRVCVGSEGPFRRNSFFPV